MKKARRGVLASALPVLLALTPSAVAQQPANDGEPYVEALNLNFEAADSPQGWPPVTVTGRVTDPDGKAVAGAHIALVAASSRAARARSAEDGRFAIEVPAGDYAITATAPGLAAYLPPSRFAPEETGEEQTVALGREGFTISGRVIDDEDKPVAGAAMRFLRFSRDTGDLFYTETDAEGRYSVRLIPADSTPSCSWTGPPGPGRWSGNNGFLKGGKGQTTSCPGRGRCPEKPPAHAPNQQLMRFFGTVSVTARTGGFGKHLPSVASVRS